MKKKKLLSGFLATALTLSTLSAGVLAAGPGNVEGSTTIGGGGELLVPEQIVDVLLPSNIAYAVTTPGTTLFSASDLKSNLLAQVEGSDIISGCFGVINHSSVPIQVDVEVSAEVSDDDNAVQLLSEEKIVENNELPKYANVDRDPAISLKIAPLNNSAYTNLSKTNNHYAEKNPAQAVSAAGVEFLSSDVLSTSGVGVDNEPANITFALSKDAYTVDTPNTFKMEMKNGGLQIISPEAVKLDADGDYSDAPVIGYTITGLVNTHAKWKGNEKLPTLSATFTITSLTDDEFDLLDMEEDALGTVKQPTELTTPGAVNGTDIEVALPAEVEDIKEITDLKVSYIDSEGVANSFGILKTAQNSSNDLVISLDTDIDTIDSVGIITVSFKYKGKKAYSTTFSSTE